MKRQPIFDGAACKRRLGKIAGGGSIRVDRAAEPAGATRGERQLRILVNFASGLIAIGLALSARCSLARSPTRQALWLTVQACVADFRLIGSAFPCLMVDLNGGEERGYVVLRDPLGPPDTILAPTRRVIGIEDPWLRSREAPNYFAAAWRARPLLKWPAGQPSAPDDFALAVRSPAPRTNFTSTSAALRRLSSGGCPPPSPPTCRSASGRASAPPQARRCGRFGPGADPQGVEPLRLAADATGGRTNLARMTLLVTQLQVAGSEESVILLSYASESEPPARVSAESMLDAVCSGGPRTSATH